LFGILGLGYELPIGKDALLIPEIRYNMPFMSIAAVSWLPATWQFGASVKFPIYPPKEIKPVDTVKYEKKELPPLLTSSIEAVGISADGTRQKNPTLVIEETEVEEGFPLLPHVFFKEGSADLSITGLHLLNKEQIEGFQEDSLQWNTLKIYSELLNIVAYRMTKQPNEKITITGCNNNLRGEENNLAISGQRADAVKKYLVDVWGINKDRINIKTQNLPDNLANNDRPDGQQENQRAEISSTNFNLMKPIYLKEISKTSTPPVVEITPSIISDTGVHDYKIVVLQGKDTIRSYEGKNNPDKILWKTADKPVPLTETPINIKLTVIDSTGRLTMASTEISIQQLTLRKKRYELKDDKRIERFSLILFDYDKAEIKANNKLILEEVKSRIKDNSTVTIEGYADRTGELEYNKSLAQRRCDEIEKILKVKEQNLVTKPIGSSVLLYDNDMPQGRSYCRTVKINIETPVGK
jgi:outer membrane protein OmpA-like peptidoglycan-associated protein